MSAGTAKLNVTVAEVKPVTEFVTRFKFVRTGGGSLPSFSGGAHTVVEMPDGDVTRLNPYSLLSDPSDDGAYMIAVRREDDGRGGSKFMHEQVREGMEMVISNPVNLFSLDLRARKHLMIAGGIGITPFMAQMKQLAALGGAYELHYSTRTPSLAAFADELTAEHAGKVHLYHTGKGQRIDLEAVLRGQPLGTHVYVCGPAGMIDWVRETASAMGWPAEAIHSEEFLAPASGQPFAVKLARSNKTIAVGEHQSLLEALEANDVDAPYLCRGGACGQCETTVVDCDGELIHYDHWLSDTQRKAGKIIMPCVSRFVGKTLVLDL